MEKDRVQEGKFYRTEAGKVHHVSMISGQKITFEETTEHGAFIDGEPVQEASLGRFAAQHEPAW